MHTVSMKSTFLFLLSCCCFTLALALVRFLSDDIHPFLAVFYRTLVAVVFLFPGIYRKGLEPLERNLLPLFTIRAVSTLVLLYAFFYSATQIPLSDAIAYSYTAPIFASIGAVFILREKMTANRLIAVSIGFIGMLILLRPGMREINLGVFAALLASVAMASVSLSVKKLTSKISATAIVFYSFLMLLPVHAIVAVQFWVWPTTEQFILLIGVGLLSIIAQFAMTRAYALADITALIPFDFSRLLFAAIFAYFLFTEIPDAYSLLGAIIIFFGVIKTAYDSSTSKSIVKGES